MNPDCITPELREAMSKLTPRQVEALETATQAAVDIWARIYLGVNENEDISGDEFEAAALMWRDLFRFLKSENAGASE